VPHLVLRADARPVQGNARVGKENDASAVTFRLVGEVIFVADCGARAG